MLEMQDTNAESMTTDMEAFDEGSFLEALDEDTEAEEEAGDTNLLSEDAADSEEDEASEAGDTNPQEEAETDKQIAPQGEETPVQGLKVTFNGEERTLTPEEAVTYAQKGLNYDHIAGKVRQLEAELAAPRGERAAFEVLTEYARVCGSTPQKILEQMSQNIISHGGTVPDKGERANTSYFREQAKADWKDFMKAYPDIKDPQNDLPKEVWEQIAGGMTPRNAYIEYQNRTLSTQIADKDREISELKAKVAALEKNEVNKKKSPGSVKSAAAGASRDPFLDGLFG